MVSILLDPRRPVPRRQMIPPLQEGLLESVGPQITLLLLWTLQIATICQIVTAQ